MATDFRLPDLGENVTGGEVVRVLVKEGDHVEKDQTVIELETDKALLEVPAPAAGKVTKVLAAVGKKLKVDDPILSLEEESAEGAEKKEESQPEAAAPQKKESEAQKKAEPPKAEKKEENGKDDVAQPPSAVTQKEEEGTSEGEEWEEEETKESSPSAKVVEVGKTEKAPEKPVVAAPSTRRLARELGVDINQVKSSGDSGRITPEDIKEFVRAKSAPAKKTTAEGGGATSQGATSKEGATVSTPIVAPPLPDFTQWGPVERKPMSNIRKRTLEQLSLSWSIIPHVTQVDEADVTELENLRARHAQYAEAKGGKLTATVFVMKAVVAALKALPNFNASIDPDSQEIIYKQYYNLGIAVDTEHGLIVPVIRDVDKKHFLDLSAELSMISERTRQRKIKLEELRGATFTISNLGGIGGSAFTPIINHPEVAILGLARYQKRVVMVNGKPTERTYLPLCLSYDHRLIDGADGARFTRKVAQMLEDPALLVLGV